MTDLSKIIVVDDHILFREGIKLLIETEGMGRVIAEAENGLVFLRMLTKLRPDLVLMDIEMPLMNGLEATSKALLRRPGLKILALTMFTDKFNYNEMISAGAMGFVAKSSGKVELERAIKTVLDGNYYFSADVLKKMVRDNMVHNTANISSIEKIPAFSEKEKEILQLYCDGLTTSEIAVKLLRSIKTIEGHRANLLEKTQTKNTINLVLYAMKNSLVSVPK